MSTPLKLTCALIGQGGIVGPIKDGRVQPKGIELEQLEVAPNDIYQRMANDQDLDVGEVGISSFLVAKTYHKPYSAIPVFKSREMTTFQILCNTGAGIKELQDLEGKRVGVRTFTLSPYTQTRAMLHSEFGVDTSKVQWVEVQEPMVAEYQRGPNVEYVARGRDALEDMLKEGELDAAVLSRGTSEGDFQWLLTQEEGNEAVVRYFRRTGVYPIGHVVTVKDETLKAHPWIAEELFHTFKAAKQLYLDGLAESEQTGEPAHHGGGDQQILWQGQIVGGDPLPFGLRESRKDLAGMIEMHVREHVIPAPLDIDSLFAPGTLDLE